MNSLNFIELGGKILEDARVRAFDENMTNGVVDTKLEFFTILRRDEYGNIQKASNIINIRFRSSNVSTLPAGRLKAGDYIYISNGQLLQETETDSFGNKLYHYFILVRDWQRVTKLSENAIDPNNIIMCGNLADKPSMKAIVKPSGEESYFLNYTLCLDYDTTRDENGNWQSKTSFIRCKYFTSRKEEAIATKANRGDRVLVYNGELRYNSWEKDGQKRESFDVNVRNYEVFARSQYQYYGASMPSQAPNTQYQGQGSNSYNNNYQNSGNQYQGSNNNNFQGGNQYQGNGKDNYQGNTRMNDQYKNAPYGGNINRDDNVSYYPPSQNGGSSDFMDDNIPF